VSRAGCALWLAVLAGVAPAQEVARPPSAAAADRRVELDVQSLYDHAELGAALRALVAAYPEFLSLSSLGHSRGGRDLWLVTVAGPGPLPEQARSALLAVGGRGVEDVHGAEMALFTLLELVQNHARDPRATRLLAEHTLYVLPVFDPDRREALLAGGGEGALDPAEPDRNLPADWSPWVSAGGPYPLSEPESVALAAFLGAHPNVAVVQTYSGDARARTGERDARLPPEDLELYRSLTAHVAAHVDEPGHLIGLPDLPSRSGSLMLYAGLELGTLVFQCGVGGREPGGLPQPYEIYLLARRAWQVTLALGDALPRLECGAPSVARLKGDQWQVDVSLRNGGLIPTRAMLARRRALVAAPRLAASGGTLIAAASRLEGAELAQPLGLRAGVPRLLDVPGGGRVDLSLFLTAAPETELALEFSAPRAGAASTSIVLR
jgi:hypothetical protein